MTFKRKSPFPQWVSFSLLSVMALFLPTIFAETPDSNTLTPPKMLVLVSAAYGRPGIETFNQGVIEAWTSHGNPSSLISVHYLDLNQNPNPSYRDELASWIRAKEKDTSFDYILLVQQDAVDFYTDELFDLSPKAKLIAAFSTLDQAWLKRTGRQGLNMIESLDYQNTLKTAFSLFPKTKRAVVVSGSTQSDRQPLSAIRKASEQWPHIQWEYTEQLTFTDTIRKLSSLPEHTIVLRSSYGSDPMGDPANMTPMEIGLELSKNTNAPSFVLYETAIGKIPVAGGHVVIPKNVGQTLIEQALAPDVWVNETTLQWLPIESTPVYDVSELVRWKADISALPENTKRLHEIPSFWRDHGKTALSIAGVMSILFIFLFFLLVERRFRVKATSALQISKTQLLTNLEYAPHVAIQWFDQDGKIIFWNPASARLYGWTSEEVIGKHLTDTFLTPEHAEDYFGRLHAMKDQGQALPPYEVHVRCKDGSERIVLTTSFVIPMEQGEMGYASMDLDITDQQLTQKHLSLLASVFKHASEGILICGADRKIEEVNDAFCQLSGFSRSELIGNTPDMLYYHVSQRDKNEVTQSLQKALKEEGHWSGEMVHRRKDGAVFTSLVTVNRVTDPSGTNDRYIALLSDITDLKQHQHRLERMAHYDAVTDLPNRVLLSERLKVAMCQLNRHPDETLAVLYIDLDGFKSVNDTHGHTVGDKMLMELARRMLAVLRETDTLARLGGDEFAAVLTNLHKHKDAERVLNLLLCAASSLMIIDDFELRVSASIGVVFLNAQDFDSDPDQLIRQADQAMYRAKATGKNRYCFFDDEEHRLERSRHEELERLKLALLNHEFELFYQPKINTTTRMLVGAEALIRWRHPDKGIVPPGLFLPLLVDHLLSIDIGYWVIETALLQIEAFKTENIHIPISVNVDGFQLSQPGFISQLKLILSRYPNYTPGDLEFEILESSALEDIEQISTIIHECKKLGICFALDDFGTGYSSLNYLKRLPVQTLKIDQSFIRNMLENPDDLAIIQGILGLAHAFKRNVIAEGVETEEHSQILNTLGCDLIQGYVVARPLPAHDFLEWHSQWSKRSRE